MELEINKNDSYFNINELTKTRQSIKRVIAGCLTAITLFSGSILGAPTAKASETNSSSYSQSINRENTTVNIPQIYRSKVAKALGKDEFETITIGDLKNYNGHLTIAVKDNSSLDWLNYCENLTSMTICPNDHDLDALQSVTALPNLNYLCVAAQYTNGEFTRENFVFLKKSPYLETLELKQVDIEPGAVEQLTQLKNLSIWNKENCKIDYSKLTFLDTLNFSLTNPYDLAIDFTMDEYNTLKDAGVEIIFCSGASANEYLEDEYIRISTRLDQMVDSLGITESSSDQEKLNAILVYVLDNLTYDPEVASLISSNIEHQDLTSSFYKGGALYGALEKDTAICGNYTALVQALAERLDLSSYYITSPNHAWNIITIEGENYFVDSTWLDGENIAIKSQQVETDEAGNVTYTTEYHFVGASEAIKQGRKDELKWYMADPINYPENTAQKESHEILYLPSFIKLKPINQEFIENPSTSEQISVQGKEEEPTEIAPTKGNNTAQPITEKDKFEVKIGPKTWIIGGAAAVGIVAAFGGAIAIKENKRKKERERRYRQNQALYYNAYNSGMFEDNFSTTNYNSSYSGRRHR